MSRVVRNPSIKFSFKIVTPIHIPANNDTKVSRVIRANIIATKGGKTDNQLGEPSAPFCSANKSPKDDKIIIEVFIRLDMISLKLDDLSISVQFIIT